MRNEPVTMSQEDIDKWPTIADGVVYVAERGEYSDRCVCGVYSSLADALADGNPVNDVEAWSVDGVPLDGKLQFWGVKMDRNGDTSYWHRDITPETRPRPAEVRVWANSRYPDGFIDCWCWAKDAAHAVKITNEHRTRMIAEGNWETFQP